MKAKDLKVGSILSETSFFKVTSVLSNAINVVDDSGNALQIGMPYVEQILQSADIFESEEKKTMTELADLFIKSPRIAMTAAFIKKDTVKTKKAYDAEKAAAIEKVQNAKVSDVAGLLSDLIDNPISRVIPGELRVMKGRHYGEIDDLGRVQFVDMELTSADAAKGLRQVDPRTLQYLIVKGVKYTLK